MAKQKIRAIALCVFRHGDRILVNEGYDSVKDQRFYRPLGGGIDFGESSQAAVVREIWEELGEAIADPVLLGVVENIFEFEGQPGHELVFLYDAQFQDASLYQRSQLTAQEGDRTFTAQWIDLPTVHAGEIPLYPKGLWSLLGFGDGAGHGQG